MADETVSIEVLARIEKFREEMEKIPGVTKAEINKAVKAMSKEWKNASADAEKAANAQKQAMNKVAAAAANVAEKLGGPFAKLGSLANGALKPILEVSAALGPVGLGGIAAAAAAVLIGATVVGLVKLGEAAGEAGKRLDALGLLTYDQSIAAEHLRDATLASAVATDQITVAMGTGTDATIGLTYAWIGLKASIADTIEAAAGWDNGFGTDDIAELGDRMTWFGGTIGFVGGEAATLARGFDLLAEKGRALTEDVKEQGEVMARVYGPSPDALDEIAHAHARVAEAARKAETAQKAAAAELARAAAEQAAEARAAAQAIADLNSMYADFHADRKTWEADLLATEETARKARASGRADTQQQEEDAAEAEKEVILAVRDTAMQAAADISSALGDVFSELADRQVDAAEKANEEWDGLLKNQASVNSQIIALRRESDKVSDESRKKDIDNQIDSLEQERDNNKVRIALAGALAEDHARRARRAFIAEKLAAIASIGMNTSIAVMNAFATLPWPANAIAAGAVVTTGGIQAGIVAAKKPPEFPMGLATSPDHTTIAALQPNERVVTSRGARDDAAVRKMNEGREGGQEFTAVVMVGRREVAAANGSGRLRVDSRAGKAGVRRRGR